MSFIKFSAGVFATLAAELCIIIFVVYSTWKYDTKDRRGHDERDCR